ncbi:MAG: hypothetical protein ACI8PZ_006793 [Myxococcota bacterium]|jgi:hypothetical protein
MLRTSLLSLVLLASVPAQASTKGGAAVRGAISAVLGNAVGAAGGYATGLAICSSGCKRRPDTPMVIGAPAGATLVGPLFPVIAHAAWGDPQVGYVGYISETTALTSGAIALTPMLVAPDSPVTTPMYITGLVGLGIGTPLAAALASMKAVGPEASLRVGPLGGRTPGLRISGRL